MEVPPSARQKFERKLTFGKLAWNYFQFHRFLADDTKNAATGGSDTNAARNSRFQMALMTKKGNRTVLKSVNLEPAQGMHEALMEQKAIQKKQREELKQLTLALDKRMTIQQHDEVCFILKSQFINPFQSAGNSSQAH